MGRTLAISLCRFPWLVFFYDIDDYLSLWLLICFSCFRYLSLCLYAIWANDFTLFVVMCSICFCPTFRVSLVIIVVVWWCCASFQLIYAVVDLFFFIRSHCIVHFSIRFTWFFFVTYCIWDTQRCFFVVFVAADAIVYLLNCSIPPNNVWISWHLIKFFAFSSCIWKYACARESLLVWYRNK